MIQAHFEVRKVFGALLAFPLNEPAIAIAAIAGTKTVTAGAVVRAEAQLGIDMALAGEQVNVLNFEVAMDRIRELLVAERVCLGQANAQRVTGDPTYAFRR
jgi:hypothetical protein